eukprot:5571045-Amphidinium_carterae.1
MSQAWNPHVFANQDLKYLIASPRRCKGRASEPAQGALNVKCVVHRCISAEKKRYNKYSDKWSNRNASYHPTAIHYRINSPNPNT